MEIAMTLAKHQTKTVITALSIMILTISMITPNLAENAYATHCTSHCYAHAYRTTYNDGNKVTITVPSISSPCTSFAVTPNWVVFNSAATDWVEVGIGKGALGSCYASETIYTYGKINGAGGWGTHGTATVGSSITFSADDSTTDQTWVIKQGTSTLRTFSSTTYSTGYGDTGVEITADSNTIASTDISNISYYSGGWNLWLGSVSFPIPSTGMWRVVCTSQNYYHMHAGTGSTVIC
jgi:hypothetical protein